MEQNIKKQPNKDDFINFVNNTLHDKGFTKDPEKETWVREKQIMVGGGVVIINNHRQETPGELHTIQHIVEIIGDGSVNDVGQKNQNPFIEVNFSVSDNGFVQPAGPTFCLFFDDQFLFNNLLNKLFGL